MVVRQRQLNEASGKYCAHRIQTIINIDVLQLLPKRNCCAVKCGQLPSLKCPLRLEELKTGVRRGEGSGGLLFS